MVDEELLKPSREHLSRIMGQIKAMEAETIERIRRNGEDDKQYIREQWEKYYLATRALSREHEAVIKVMTDYYALQADLPPMVLSHGQTLPSNDLR